MTCKAWTQSDEAFEEFAASATEIQMENGLHEVWSLATGFKSKHNPTARRLFALHDKLFERGQARFGQTFGIPF